MECTHTHTHTLPGCTWTKQGQCRGTPRVWTGLFCDAEHWDWVRGQSGRYIQHPDAETAASLALQPLDIPLSAVNEAPRAATAAPLWARHQSHCVPLHFTAWLVLAGPEVWHGHSYKQCPCAVKSHPCHIHAHPQNNCRSAKGAPNYHVIKFQHWTARAAGWAISPFIMS